MNKQSLSVLLPCRDSAEYLPEAIRSLRSQTYGEFEIVAVDDGSSDNSGELLERWATRDSRVRVVPLPGVGLARALQVGSELCQGELIARADADDVSHPRRFAEQVELLAKHRDLTAVGTHVRYFPHDRVGWGARRYQSWLNSLSEPRSLARDMFVECPIAHPTLMVRRSAFVEAGGYRINGWPEDYDLLLRLHLGGARMANVAQVLYFWREREERASRNDSRYSAAAFRRCKIHYLLRSCLAGRRAVNLWGAGRVGKAFARALLDQGTHVQCFFDIDPRKIGQEIHGAPVRDAQTVASYRDTYLLVAVGSVGARALIRRELDQIGFREPEDYRVVA